MSTSGVATSLANTVFDDHAHLYHPSSNGLPPETACTHFMYLGNWECMDTHGIPEDEFLDAFAMKTTLGSRFAIRGQPEVFVAPDGLSTSTVPEDVLVAMRAEPAVHMHTPPAGYTWATNHDVVPDDSVGLVCPSGYAERIFSTRWLDEHDVEAPDIPACNIETFFGSEAFLAPDAMSPAPWCGSTTHATPFDGTYVSDLVGVDFDTLRHLQNPYRQSLQAFMNPFSDAPAGMTSNQTAFGCFSGAEELQVISDDPLLTVRQAVRDTLTNHRVPRLGTDQAPWLRVERDFCGMPRQPMTTVGAFEVGRECPGAF